MIYATAIAFPVIALIAGLAVLGALGSFVRDIQRDLREKKTAP